MIDFIFVFIDMGYIILLIFVRLYPLLNKSQNSIRLFVSEVLLKYPILFANAWSKVGSMYSIFSKGIRSIPFSLLIMARVIPCHHQNLDKIYLLPKNQQPLCCCWIYLTWMDIYNKKDEVLNHVKISYHKMFGKIWMRKN